MIARSSIPVGSRGSPIAPSRIASWPRISSSALGGNCELSRVGETVETPNGVTIIAPDNLPATMPAGASAFYARNISALLLGMVKDGALHLDFEDEVTKATVITRDGAVVSDAVNKLLNPGGQA